ncbi:M23 family metallopeptidase [Paraurantiacibacter namhicola]|uniref:Peptidase family M23 n=1 Tax=Paraurantiacibacter namhicola TaxID=645517 RepID=A0A1C7D5F2_9SPHN|nr:M23 family metallopeptidase [Paraurantiacibacter namhicola]ANU06551.1 Peptidase family M23 [Paraurantiacibacter namhicola]
MRNSILFAGALSCIAAPAFAQGSSQYQPSAEEVDAIAAGLPQLMLHPLYDEPYVCSEHPFGTSMEPGDSLGQDCLIIGGMDWETNSGFMTYYRTDGGENSDWYGWGKPVFAPAAGTIGRVHVNEVVNTPGTMIRGLPTMLSITDEAGNSYVIGHLGEIHVEEGQSVAAGEQIGTVGNNGNSRSPHIHVGAITADGKPAQIRWNLVTSALRTRDYVTKMRAESKAGGHAEAE